MNDVATSFHLRVLPQRDQWDVPNWEIAPTALVHAKASDKEHEVPPCICLPDTLATLRDIQLQALAYLPLFFLRNGRSRRCGSCLPRQRLFARQRTILLRLQLFGAHDKKADVVKHPQAFHYVGLLVNRPPGSSRVAFHLVIRQLQIVYRQDVGHQWPILYRYCRIQFSMDKWPTKVASSFFNRNHGRPADSRFQTGVWKREVID
jgi:hypothetical protein